MRIRKIGRGDLAGIISVYNRRADTSNGLIRRSSEEWRHRRRLKESRGCWYVAEDHGSIVGYGIGTMAGKRMFAMEIMWLPEYDSTLVGGKLLEALMRKTNDEKSFMPATWEMPGSPVIPTLKSAGFIHFDAPFVFMSKVIDTRFLLRDARRILTPRVEGRICMHVNGGVAVVGKGKKIDVEVQTSPDVLLNLMLGLSILKDEIRKGGLKFSPQNKNSLNLLRSAFPDRKFWIKDWW